MHTEFRGECTYQADSDIHFPHLTLSQTLAVAVEARAARSNQGRLHPVSSDSCDTTTRRDTITQALGLSHVHDTKMGGDFVVGLSGGERKRASIAELLISNSTLQCWDNSTRGLDSANALQFVKILRFSARITGSSAIVSLYQASEDIFKVCRPIQRTTKLRQDCSCLTRLYFFTKAIRYSSEVSKQLRCSSLTWGSSAVNELVQQIF